MYIEKLKYFIDLYDCRNFTETARKNYISQATISQYISSLEKEFDTVFFDRSKNPIRPTESGKIFYDHAQLLLRQYEETQEAICRSQSQQIPKITLAYTSLSDIKLLLPLISFLKNQPQVFSVELEKVDCKDIENYLLKGLADMALSFSEEFMNEDISKMIVKSGTYRALVPKGHDLFKYDSIDVENLYKYPLLMLSEEKMGKPYQTMRERSLEDGFYPNIARTVDDFEEGFFYILTEQLIGFAIDEYALDNLKGIIKSIPINSSQHTYELVLAYKDDTENEALAQFIRQLSTYIL
ncbi:LysR family transcriptional regulator [Streptococcus tangpeifui]|uniref:LysR family transcriptional regulator n=1 Tax=Streptococcus tangpeifui TaxID=2709400 RepID=UPI0013EB35FB|nr:MULTISPECIES: LysR family transcriptional regulator [unclassified Streptococcus]